MSLLSIIVTLIVVGVVLWAINEFLPMDAKVKKLLNVVVIVVAAIYVLQAFGLIDALSRVNIGGHGHR